MIWAREPAPTVRVARLDRVGLNTRDARRLARFYRQALGARVISVDRVDAAPGTVRGTPGGAERTMLALGCSHLELWQFDEPGLPYPAEVPPWDTRFQHCALVVRDMQPAFRRLAQAPGWAPITHGEPQRLPASAGAVTAFKFRDPDGHPLELLSFPGHGPSPWRTVVTGDDVLGIDHSALSVADVARSVVFYAALGLATTARSLNRGPEQQRLDGVTEPLVDVIALTPPHGTPHVELLHYRGIVPRQEPAHWNDVAATRLIFEAAVEAPPGAADRTREPMGRPILDPDGHHLLIVAAAP